MAGWEGSSQLKESAYLGGKFITRGSGWLEDFRWGCTVPGSSPLEGFLGHGSGSKRVGLGCCEWPGNPKKSWEMLVTKLRSPYSLEETGNFLARSVVRLACREIPGGMAERPQSQELHFVQRSEPGRILVVLVPSCPLNLCHLKAFSSRFATCWMAGCLSRSGSPWSD